MTETHTRLYSPSFTTQATRKGIELVTSSRCRWDVVAVARPRPLDYGIMPTTICRETRPHDSNLRHSESGEQPKSLLPVRTK